MISGSVAPLSAYVHVPFCASRCGYCDFNTYTPGELNADSKIGGAEGVSGAVQQWFHAVCEEIDMAHHRMQECSTDRRELSTVFIGGGTPSLVGGPIIAGIVDHLRSSFGIAANAEVTMEANPESTTEQLLSEILQSGVNRLSVGMQSTADHVLQVLDRTHSPGRALGVVASALDAGFEHVNLDLIYGAPGESDDDLRRTIDDALSTGVDHISAYALIVEEGTALARRIRRGEIPNTDDDEHADRYEILAKAMADAGFNWYEVSNYAKTESARCHHNLHYWSGDDWWGFGPGAHSHVAGTRWWNRKLPAKYAASIAQGEFPVQGHEILTAEQRHMETVMLGLRLKAGIRCSELSADELTRAMMAVEDGTLRRSADRIALTESGRLLADGLIAQILG